MHRRSIHGAVLVAGALALAVVLAACGSGTGSSAAASPAPASSGPGASTPAAGGGSGAVAIKDFAFAPATLDVPLGTTVTWTNLDSAGHTATADDGSFDSGKLDTGGTFSHTFSTAGTYAFHCAIHSSMTGTIVVQ